MGGGVAFGLGLFLYFAYPKSPFGSAFRTRHLRRGLASRDFFKGPLRLSHTSQRESRERNWKLVIEA